jgi:hypothetical protein
MNHRLKDLSRNLSKSTSSKGSKGSKGNKVIKWLLVAGSAVMLSSGAGVAEAAIFTVEYSGSVTTADISNDPLVAKVGDRIAGRYTFDGTTNELVLGRFDFFSAASTDSLNPAVVSSSESTYRQNVPGSGYVPGFVIRNSFADQNSASFESFLALGRAGGNNGTYFSVNDRAFSYVFRSIPQPNPPFVSITGSINSFSLVNNVTPNITTSPTIPTEASPTVPTPAPPAPIPTPPVPPVSSPENGPISVPEPAPLAGLLLLAGSAAGLLWRDSLGGLRDRALKL